MRKLNTSFFKSSFMILNSKDCQLFAETIHKKTEISSGREKVLIFSDLIVKKTN